MADTVALSLFLPYVRKHFNKVHDDLLTQELRLAIIDFCEMSYAWRHDVSLLDVYADENCYQFKMPVGARLVEVNRMTYDGKKIYKKSENQLDTLIEGWMTEKGEPEYFAIKDLKRALVYVTPVPTADAIEKLSATLILKPTKTAAIIGMDLYEDYAEAIGIGAAARLKLYKDKAWTDLEGGKLLMEQFFARAQAAKEDYNRHFNRQERLRAKPSPI